MTPQPTAMAQPMKLAAETLAIAVVYIATAQPGFLIAIAPVKWRGPWTPAAVIPAAG